MKTRHDVNYDKFETYKIPKKKRAGPVFIYKEPIARGEKTPF